MAYSSKHIDQFTAKIAYPTMLLFIGLALGYACLFWFYEDSIVSRWLLIPIGAFLAYGMFTIAHEASHGNISGGHTKLKWLETTLGWLASITLFFPYSAFVVIHLHHHAHTNDPEKDPDSYVNGNGVVSIFMRCLTLVGHYYKESFNSKNSMHTNMQGKRAHAIFFLIVICAIVLGFVMMGKIDTFLFVFLFPALVAAPFLGFTFDWLPHYPHHNMGTHHNTRIVTLPVLEWISFFQSYHHIHHLYPRVPFYNYKLKFKAVEEELHAKSTPIEGFGSREASLFRAENTYHDLKKEAPWHYALNVSEVKWLTNDSARIEFKNFNELPFKFKAGQYLVLSRQVHNKTISRCYSICSNPNSGKLAIGVKRVPGGQLSNTILDTVTADTSVNIKGPFGTFMFKEKGIHASPTSHHVFIAGGSGITPILSMISKALEDGVSNIQLIYGCRSEQHVMFKDELEKLASAYPNVFSLQITYQLLTPNYQKELLNPLNDNASYYLCGPELMMDASKEVLAHFKVTPENIISETFKIPSTALEGITHTIKRNDKSFVGYESETILEASLRNNTPLPYACGVGQCGTCKVKVLSGEVAWKKLEQTTLLANEKEQGYILSCLCTPKTAIYLEIPK